MASVDVSDDISTLLDCVEVLLVEGEGLTYVFVDGGGFGVDVLVDGLLDCECVFSVCHTKIYGLCSP